MIHSAVLRENLRPLSSSHATLLLQSPLICFQCTHLLVVGCSFSFQFVFLVVSISREAITTIIDPILAQAVFLSRAAVHIYSWLLLKGFNSFQCSSVIFSISYTHFTPFHHPLVYFCFLFYANRACFTFFKVLLLHKVTQRQFLVVHPALTCPQNVVEMNHVLIDAWKSFLEWRERLNRMKLED